MNNPLDMYRQYQKQIERAIKRKNYTQLSRYVTPILNTIGPYIRTITDEEEKERLWDLDDTLRIALIRAADTTEYEDEGVVDVRGKETHDIESDGAKEEGESEEGIGGVVCPNTNEEDAGGERDVISNALNFSDPLEIPQSYQPPETSALKNPAPIETVLPVPPFDSSPADSDTIVYADDKIDEFLREHGDADDLLTEGACDAILTLGEAFADDDIDSYLSTPVDDYSDIFAVLDDPKPPINTGEVEKKPLDKGEDVVYKKQETDLIDRLRYWQCEIMEGRE